MLEYVYSEFEYEEIIDELTESILSDDEESWYDHCSSNWYNYGDSEYGLNTSILEISINSIDLNNSTEIYLGERETFDRFQNIGEERFIFEASSYEAGEYVFEEMTLEFEFRPECLSIETSDFKMLINGIEYSNPETDEDFYSSGELVNSQTKGTDIELFFKNKNGELTCVNNYEDIRESIEENDEEVNEKTIHSYFIK
jgi:hypothetical protein